MFIKLIVELINQSINSKTDDILMQAPRDLFESEVVKDGLLIKRSQVEKWTFVKVLFDFLKKILFFQIYCPFERMCLQAERVRLEMPLKDVSFV